MPKNKDTDPNVSPTEPTEPSEPTEPTEPTEPSEPTELTKPQAPFTPEEEQRIGSMVGRIVANQLDTKVIPHLNKESAPIDTGIPTGGDAITKFNEKLQEKIFAGDVLGAIQMANEVQNKAKSNVTNLQKVQTDKLLVSYAEKPYYKDIFSDMKKIAHEKVALGFPPEAAVEQGYLSATNQHLEKQLGGGTEDTGSLEMLSGGKRTKSTKKLTLPPSLKAAAERDIAAGYYKTEEEWIAALSPQVRKANGLGE